MPIRLQDRFLFVGPVIGPDTPCLVCFDKRTLAKPPYSRSSEVERLVRRYRNLSSRRSEGVGFTPAVASIAAALALDVAVDPAAYGGQFWQVDCLHTTIEAGTASSVPDCQKCEAADASHEEPSRGRRYTGTTMATIRSLTGG